MRRRPSIYGELKQRELENLLEAIRHDKYWRVSPGDDRLFYAVILTRARTPSSRGRLVRVTGFGQVVASGMAAAFCRRYRVGVIDSKDGRLVAVLTWRAFSWIMRNCPEAVYAGLVSGSAPSYLNVMQAKSLCSEHGKIP